MWKICAKSNERMIVGRDNIGGLAKEIDLLRDLHHDALAFNNLPGKLGRQLSRQSIIAK